METFLSPVERGLAPGGSAPAFDASRLDAVIDTALAEKRIVGTVVLVKKDGDFVYRRSAGLADREASIPMSENAVFRLASITKPIVSAAALRLVEMGRISLNDPVSRWLPDFQPSLGDGTRPAITIHQLLTHTAGLSYSFLEPADSPYHRLGISDGLDRPDRSLAENLRLLAQAPLLFAPGSLWRYSLGIDVVGAILERATGTALPVLVHELITGPLAMTNTGFLVGDDVELAAAYSDGGAEPSLMHDGIEVPLYDGHVRFAPSRARSRSAYPSGGAGMVGSADEIMNFLEAIRIGGGSILSPETVNVMMRDSVGPQAETQGPGWGFGYGWAVLSQPALASTPQNRGTIQWGGAYGHSWFVDRTGGISVVALTNTAFEGMSGAFPGQVRDAVYAGL